MKTPTLAIVCKRELEIRNFVPIADSEVVATRKSRAANSRCGTRLRIESSGVRLLRKLLVRLVASRTRLSWASRISGKRRPKLHDLPSLQKLCGSRFGWPASKTLEVAQELYDGQGKKIITYPRAEVRYLPQSLMSDVPRIVAGLRVGQSFV